MGSAVLMMMRISLLLVLLSALCFHESLGLRDDVNEFFTDMDKNTDGTISFPELSDWLRNDYEDRIGVEKYEETDAKELFKQIDGNHDGKLTRTEVEGMSVFAEHKSEEEDDDLYHDEDYSDSLETELDEISASQRTLETRSS